MNTPTAESIEQSRRMRRAFAISTLFTAVLWLIKLTESILELDLSLHGVYPRSATGLQGILFAPLIHSSYEHLLANTAPCVVLLALLLYGYARSARLVLPVIYFGSGVVVWLVARSSYHIGASGVTFGLMFFIFMLGILRKDKQAIALSLVVFFLYGGMMGGFFPEDQTISYESHAAGALLGIALAFVCRDFDPPPPQKKYSWEEELDPQDDDDFYQQNTEDPF